MHVEKINEKTEAKKSRGTVLFKGEAEWRPHREVVFTSEGSAKFEPFKGYFRDLCYESAG
jgi:hypothetical protein